MSDDRCPGCGGDGSTWKIIGGVAVEINCPQCKGSGVISKPHKNNKDDLPLNHINESKSENNHYPTGSINDIDLIF